MSYLLKIVEGPNRGAEIALVDGVQVSLGKGDDCDIVLADPTLPDAPVSIEAHADGVTVNGEALAPFAVKTLGATSLAVGPADAPWGPLTWPEKEPESPKDEGGSQGEPDAPAAPTAPAEPAAPEDHGKPGKRRHGRIVAVAATALLLLILLLGLARCSRSSSGFRTSGESTETGISGEAALSTIAERYGLSLAETNGTATLSGNLATRRERMAATTEAYAAAPGIALDLSDDESFRTSAEDALFTLTEGALKVVAATNRHLRISGSASSPAALTKTMEALAADLPKLRSFDVTGVVLATVPSVASAEQPSARQAEAARKAAARRPAAASLPVCGILTVPYPCVVLRDGRRLMEGAMLGDSVILRIEPDSVTLTNSTGRIAWKP